MAACALVFPRTSQRPVALLLMIAAGLTLLEWMLLLKIVGGAGIVGIDRTAAAPRAGLGSAR